MSFEIDTATDYIDLMDRLNTWLTAKGSAFGLTSNPANTGNGTVTAYRGGASSVAETFTLTATSATNFTVVGSVTGSVGPATVGTPFAHATIEFTINAGGAAFVSGDIFTISTAPPWTNLRRCLGCRVTATQRNTGLWGAQNLVDGQNASDSNRVWRVDTPVTIPQDVEFQFFEAETIAEYHLAAFSANGGNCPSAWTFDYWNGSTWVNLDTQSGITGWGATEVKTFTISSPASAPLYRLQITAIPFTNLVTLGAVRLLRSDGVDAAFSQMIWEAPGNDGDSQIYCGVHAFERQDADYYNWEVASFDGHNAASRFYAQAGYEGKKFLPLWDDTIPYWFVNDGRSVRVVAKIDSNYEVALMAFGEQYLSPEQLPYNAILGGSIALGASLPTWESVQYRYSNSSNNHRAPTHADAAGASSPVSANFQLSARLQTGAWEGFEGSVNDIVTSAPSGTRNIIWPTRCGFSLLDVNLDGTYTRERVFLNSATPNTLGELSGVSIVTGQGQTAETLDREGEIDWLVVPNIFRSDRDDYLAVALD